jgi:hypothetical protein
MEPLPPPVQFTLELENFPARSRRYIRHRRRRAPVLPAWLKLSLNIVGGGITGVTLSILILWWGLGMDPFEVGPLVAKHYPLAVPAKFAKTPALEHKQGNPRNN